jgi:acetate kinase
MAPSQKLVLALNAGSSSLKASVIRDEETIISFLAERLMTPDAIIRINHVGKPNMEVEKEGNESYDHAEALSKIIGYIESNAMLNGLICVGHRVVHGGTIFPDSALVTEKTLEQIKSVSHLAPLYVVTTFLTVLCCPAGSRAACFMDDMH